MFSVALCPFSLEDFKKPWSVIFPYECVRMHLFIYYYIKMRSFKLEMLRPLLICACQAV